MTRKVFNYGGGMHSPTALTAFLRDALDGDVADGMKVVVGGGMSVTVQAGTARVGKDPSYDINVTGTESVDVGAASPSNPMNAVIVAYVDRSVVGTTSVTDNTNDVFKLKAVSAAASPSPSDPSTSAIQSAIGASNPYIILARVRKRTGATSIISSDITDLRSMVTLKAGRISSSGILADNIIKSGHLSNDIVLSRHLKFSDLVPVHKNISRVDSFRTNAGYQKTSLSQYSASFSTTPGAKYEVIAHTEYINYGSEPNGELDLQLEIGGTIIAKNTSTGSPLTQMARTLVGEFTASSATTRLDAFIVSSVTRTISIYQGYLRVMRIG